MKIDVRIYEIGLCEHRGLRMVMLQVLVIHETVTLHDDTWMAGWQDRPAEVANYLMEHYNGTSWFYQSAWTLAMIDPQQVRPNPVILPGLTSA